MGAYAHLLINLKEASNFRVAASFTDAYYFSFLFCSISPSVYSIPIYFNLAYAAVIYDIICGS